MAAFSSLALSPALLQALEVLEYREMTPVQAESLPPMLEGRDVIAKARTGSGKTAAFGLGLLSSLDATAERAQALVLCPTRELAEQVAAELRRLARFIPNVKLVALCGGVPTRPQKASLERAPHIVVGTPGRIRDHLQRGNLDLSGLKVLVLDEADRMLDMGFQDEIAEVLAATPKRRQTLLFSATFPEDIRAMSGRVQMRPVEVTVEPPPEGDIEEVFYEVEPEQKLDALLALLRLHAPAAALVFCHTKRDAAHVANELSRKGAAALSLHGDLDQREREEVLVRFANQSCTLLVATDVAARGLDIPALPAVISYELPQDPDVHLHRIGRTGRAGAKGLALHLCSPREKGRAKAIEARRGERLRWARLDVTSGKETALEPPLMATLFIEGGKKDKLRAGDLLGALTGDVGLPGAAVGKIDILPGRSYVAVRREHAERARAALNAGKIKGRSFRVRRL